MAGDLRLRVAIPLAIFFIGFLIGSSSESKEIALPAILAKFSPVRRFSQYFKLFFVSLFTQLPRLIAQSIFGIWTLLKWIIHLFGQPFFRPIVLLFKAIRYFLAAVIAVFSSCFTTLVMVVTPSTPSVCYAPPSGSRWIRCAGSYAWNFFYRAHNISSHFSIRVEKALLSTFFPEGPPGERKERNVTRPVNLVRRPPPPKSSQCTEPGAKGKSEPLPSQNLDELDNRLKSLEANANEFKNILAPFA
jgi:hypothetical protein